MKSICKFWPVGRRYVKCMQMLSYRDLNFSYTDEQSPGYTVPGRMSSAAVIILREHSGVKLLQECTFYLTEHASVAECRAVRLANVCAMPKATYVPDLMSSNSMDHLTPSTIYFWGYISRR